MVDGWEINVGLGCQGTRFMTPEFQIAGSETTQDVWHFFEDRKPIGGTNLHQTFQDIAKSIPADQPTRIVYIGDGIDTLGAREGKGLVDSIKKLFKGKQVELSTVAIGSSYDQRILKTLAAKLGGTFRAIEGESDIFEAADKVLSSLFRPVLKNVQVQFDGLKVAALYPPTLGTLAIGDTGLILGRLLKAGSGNLIITGEVEGRSFKRVYPVKLNPNTNENRFLPRLWAKAHQDHLHQQMGIGGRERDGYLKNQIIATSIHYQIMSPFTAFLVLESESDYKRFGIVRKLRMVDWRGELGGVTHLDPAKQGKPKGAVTSTPALRPLAKKDFQLLMLPSPWIGRMMNFGTAYAPLSMPEKGILDIHASIGRIQGKTTNSVSESLPGDWLFASQNKNPIAIDGLYRLALSGARMDRQGTYERAQNEVLSVLATGSSFEDSLEGNERGANFGPAVWKDAFGLGDGRRKFNQQRAQSSFKPRESSEMDHFLGMDGEISVDNSESMDAFPALEKFAEKREAAWDSPFSFSKGKELRQELKKSLDAKFDWDRADSLFSPFDELEEEVHKIVRKKSKAQKSAFGTFGRRIGGKGGGWAGKLRGNKRSREFAQNANANRNNYFDRHYGYGAQTFLLGKSTIQINRLWSNELTGRRAVLVDPENDQIRFSLMRTLMRSGKVAGGVKNLQVLLKKYPKNPKLLLEAAWQNHLTGKKEEAAAQIQLAIQVVKSDKDPKVRQVLLPQFGRELGNIGKSKEASQLFLSLAREVTDDKKFALSVGYFQTAFNYTADKSEAEVIITEMMKRWPKNGTAVNAAAAYYQVRNPKRALALASQASELKIQNWQMRFSILFSLQRTNEAWAVWHDRLASAKNQSEIWQALTQGYGHDQKKTYDWCRNIIQTGKGIQLQGVVMFLQNYAYQMPEGIKDLLLARAIKSDFPASVRLKAFYVMHYRGGKNKKWAMILLPLVKAFEGDDKTARGLAIQAVNNLAQRGYGEIVEKELAQLLKREDLSDNETQQLTLAHYQTFWQGGKQEKALEILEEAFRQSTNPSNAYALLQTSISGLFAQQKGKKAAELLARMINRFPQFQNTRYLLQQLRQHIQSYRTPDVWRHFVKIMGEQREAWHKTPLNEQRRENQT